MCGLGMSWRFLFVCPHSLQASGGKMPLNSARLEMGLICDTSWGLMLQAKAELSRNVTSKDQCKPLEKAETKTFSDQFLLRRLESRGRGISSLQSAPPHISVAVNVSNPRAVCESLTEIAANFPTLSSSQSARPSFSSQ